MSVFAQHALAAACAASAALAAPIALAAGGRADERVLPLRTLVRGEHGPTAIALGTWAAAVTDASGGQTFELTVKSRDLDKLDAMPWRRRFVVGVVTTHTTDGYAVSIRRITLQAIGGGNRQLCVVAAVTGPRPGRVVLQERTAAYHIVSTPNDVLPSFEAPPAVLRDVSGKLLYKPGGFGFSTPVRPDVCRAR